MTISIAFGDWRGFGETLAGDWVGWEGGCGVLREGWMDCRMDGVCV